MAELVARLQTALGDAYRVEKEIGGGGMSRVFLATEVSLHRQVVIKLLPPELASEVSQARFRQEIELAARLQHTNILPVLTAGARDDLLYYVMPFVSGESLRHRLTREGKLPIPDAVRIIQEIGDALSYAHVEGVIHRDIKPENILLLGNHAVLMDFGVARALAEARSGERLTETGMGVGTPGYMSPEQAAGESHIDGRADVYALAVVGYEMLAGVAPFEGPTAQAVLAAHLTKTARPVREIRPEVPVAVNDAIVRALAKDPAQRLHTAAEFRDALGMAATGTGNAAARPSPVRRLGIAAVGLIVVAVGAFFLLRGKPAASLDPNLVAIAPFDVLDPQLELWHEGLVDILSRNLDGAGPVRTVPPTIVVRRWSGRADPSSAAELGRSTGAGIVVFGGLVGAGPDSVRMTAAILDVASGKTIADLAFREVAARADRLGDSLTVAVLRELGKSRPVGAVRQASLGSASVPAVKAFLRGEQFVRSASWDSALVYYEMAVERDSSFTLALWRVGFARYWLNAGDPLWGVLWLRAGAANRGLAPRESLLVAGDSLLASIYEGKAMPGPLIARYFATLTEATHRYPLDPEGWYRLGEAYMHFGYGVPEAADQALSGFEHAIALDSAFAPAFEHAIEFQVDRDPERARRYIATWLSLGPGPDEEAALRIVQRVLELNGAVVIPDAELDTLPADVLLALYFFLRGSSDSTETAVRATRALATSHGPFHRGPPYQRRILFPALLAYHGRLREAYPVLASDPDPRITFNRSTLVELALLGTVPRDSAVGRFSQWLRAGDFTANTASLWWAQVGDTGSIQAFARVAADSTRAAVLASRRGFWTYAAAATGPYLALARRDTLAALRGFAALPDSLCPACYLERYARGRLLAALGRNDEAAPLLDKELFLPDVGRPSGVLWALERGRVNERLGNRDKARDAFALVATVWRHADPELQPYVEEAKAALARLGSEPRR